MEIEGGRQLRSSSSRNFSRPLPSPLTAISLNTPTKQSKHQDVFTRLPRSASLFSLSTRAPDASENLASNRLIDFSRQAAGTVANIKSQTASAVKTSAYSKIRPSPESLVRSLSHFSLDEPVKNITSRTWNSLERDRPCLHLDLFQPVPTPLPTSTRKPQLRHVQSRERLISPSEDDNPPSRLRPCLQPLLQFRQLHNLKLTGMLESYQSIIWSVCWLQPFLQSLHLEMTISPLFHPETEQPNRVINSAWTLDNDCRSDPNKSGYLGNHGDGTLHEEFGTGEYLDSQAIKMAQQDVAAELPFNNIRYLPIEKLTLVNFVVDGGSIMRWFDPKRLKELEFGHGCIDAGLYIAEEMAHVTLIIPQNKAKYYLARAMEPGELKVIELKKGQIVSRKDALSGREELATAQKQPGLKAKVSQLFLGIGGGRNKDP